MYSNEVRIIGGASAEVPERTGLGRFLIEEGAWILAALAVTILTVSSLQTFGGRFASAAPGVALFGLHGLVGIHVLRTEAGKVAAWLRFDRRSIVYGVAGGAFLLGFNVLYGLALDAMGVTPPDVAAVLRGILPRALMILWAAVMAPIVEELYFRGKLLDAFGVKLGAAWAAVISSGLFAAIHGIKEFMVAYVVFALVLIALRRRTGGLTAPIIAHVINNAFALFS